MSPRGRAAVAGAALVLFLIAAGWQSALAGWQDDYRKGREALDEGNYDRAISKLRAAIRDKNSEKARAIKVSGMFFEPYLPHFYLGMALFNKEEYAEALEELETSESMDVVTKDSALMAQLTQTKKVAAQLAQAAASKPPPAAQPPPPAAQPATPEPTGSGTGGGAAKDTSPPAGGSSSSGGATEPQAPVTQAEPLKPPPAPAGPDPELLQARAAAAGDIARALKLKTDAGSDLSTQEKDGLEAAVKAVREAESPSQARAAHQGLQKTIADASRAVDQRRSQRAARELAQARREAGDVLEKGRKLLADSGSDLKNSEKSRLTRGISALENAGSPEAVRQAARTLGNEVEGLKKTLTQRAAAPPPVDQGQARAEALAQARRAYAGAVEAYFQGNYESAVTGLEAAGDDIEDDPELHAILGSALYRQFILTRSRNEALRTRAEEAFRNALEIKPDFRLDTATYPPKVISFFRQVASGSSGQ